MGSQEGARPAGQPPAGRGHRHPHRAPAGRLPPGRSSSGRATSRPWRQAGWEIVEVPPADDCPDGVFVEDTVVVFRNVAVHHPPRRRVPQARGRRRRADGGGARLLHQPDPSPGTLDGGDVLKVGDTIYVGSGGRTNADGLRQLRNILGPLGATVIAVPGPLRKVLHLKSAVTALPDGTVIGYPPLVDDPGLLPSLPGRARGVGGPRRRSRRRTRSSWRPTVPRAMRCSPTSATSP